MWLDREGDDAEFGRDPGVDHQRGARADPVAESYGNGVDVGFDATTAPASTETQAEAEAVDSGTAEAATATASASTASAASASASAAATTGGR